jgi:hypothetical protein
MKKFIFALLILAIPFIGVAQNNSFHKTITVTTDAVSKDTATVWQEFSSTRYSKDLSATQIDPSDDFGFMGNLTAYIYVDSVAAVQPTADSLMWKIERIDAVGTPIGNPVYVNLTNNSATTTATWNSFTPSNRSATDIETMWVDLRGEFEDWPGIKHSFIYWDTGVSATLSIKLHTFQMR